MLQQLLRDTVVVVRAPLIPGPYNSGDVPDWPNATRTTVAGFVHPVSSTEDVVLQSRTETKWRMFIRPEVSLLATDRVEWDDGSGVKSYEVDGEVEVHRARGVRHHQTCVLSRVSGG